MPGLDWTVNHERIAFVFRYNENTLPPDDTWRYVDDDLDLSWRLPSGGLAEVCWDGQYYVTMWNGVMRSFAGFRTHFRTRTMAAYIVEAVVRGRPDVYR